METIVRIPTPLRTLTGGSDEVTAAGDTVGELIENLEQKHLGIRERLLDEKGVRRFVNIYVRDEDVRFLDDPPRRPLLRADAMGAPIHVVRFVLSSMTDIW
jgi:molybdopterin synthase sulfur carrier subunit